MTNTRKIDFNVIGEAFNIVKDKWQPFVIAGLISVIAVAVIEGIFYVPIMGLVLGGRDAAVLLIFPMYALLAFVVMVLMGLVQAGMMNMSLKAVRKEPVELADFMAPLKAPGPFLIAAVLLGICTMIGYIGCGIGALIVASLTMFTIPLMIDKRLAPMDALKESIEILKSQWLMAACFLFVAMLVGELGAIACGIGVIFTLPVAFLSIALCYRDLVWGSDGAAAAAAPAADVVTPAEAAAAQAEIDSPAATPEPPAEPAPEPPAEPEPPTES